MGGSATGQDEANHLCSDWLHLARSGSTTQHKELGKGLPWPLAGAYRSSGFLLGETWKLGPEVLQFAIWTVFNLRSGVLFSEERESIVAREFS